MKRTRFNELTRRDFFSNIASGWPLLSVGNAGVPPLRETESGSDSMATNPISDFQGSYHAVNISTIIGDWIPAIVPETQPTSDDDADEREK